MRHFAAIAGVLFITTAASASEPEGAYKVTESEGCRNQGTDTVVLYTDAESELRASMASAELGTVHQSYRLARDGAALSGWTTRDSPDDGVFHGTISDDGSVLEGFVQSLGCDEPWRFKATRAQVSYAEGLQPLDGEVSIATFAGAFTVKTDSLEGQLKLMRLDDGRGLARFTTDTSGVLIRFDTVRLDGGALELFNHDIRGVRIKWRLAYGTRDGRLALEGYGISVNGRLYPVSAAESGAESNGIR